jgi:predicted O-methyltransferase YrrM
VGKINFLLNYISYLFSAGDEHSIHSPFVFDLYTKAIKPRKKFYVFNGIESLRNELLQSKRSITIKDFGAGSKVDSSLTRTIGSIAKHSEKAPHIAHLIFRIIEYLKPTVIFDLGTSLGITTIYEASVHQRSKVITFEGCPETSMIARENFRRRHLTNIELIEGNIDETLPKKTKEIQQIDYVFFDANHRYEPTIRYFETCLEKAHDDSVFVFDDIHWSQEMEKAWEYIRNHPRVIITIDLFFIGLVFFRKKQPKQHFTLKF